MKSKKIVIFLIIVAIAAIGVAVTINAKKSDTLPAGSSESNIAYYTCGMHPSVKVSAEEFENGNTMCPICNMMLTPVQTDVQEQAEYYGCGCVGEEHVFQMKDMEGKNCPICDMPLKKLTEAEADSLKGVVGKVKIKGEQARLAGVQTETAKKLHLYEEIRTVGRVAYDPQLAIAQEEFISSLKASDKMQEGGISEIKERASNLVESARRKLILLGLSIEQIQELEKTKEIYSGLILPEEKMWIYGDVYEYELSWLKVGDKVKVTAASLAGEEIFGIISSVNPVLDAKTRSVRFRAEVDNPNLKLKPEMYVDVVIMGMYTDAEGAHMVLAVPKDAVLDTGIRKIIWIDKGSGEYEGREVQVGPEATATIDEKEAKFYPILSGVAEGEKVVTRANFLIDSQSQISGVAASAYGGALGADDEKGSPKGAPGHVH
ncbi:efflux RND transporter periplasmic adaptor subunit [Candidatus Omnitrophota bacterium]